MARKYPRFLFSNPTYTKSKGPFVIYTLYPRTIFKVSRNLYDQEVNELTWEKYGIVLIYIDDKIKHTDFVSDQHYRAHIATLKNIAAEILDWLFINIKNKEISF